jgi:hypothetical protein
MRNRWDEKPLRFDSKPQLTASQSQSIFRYSKMNTELNFDQTFCELFISKTDLIFNHKVLTNNMKNKWIRIESYNNIEWNEKLSQTLLEIQLLTIRNISENKLNICLNEKNN